MSDTIASALRKIARIHHGDGHPTWGAVWLDLGRLRLIRSASGHPNTWMICWRRRLPEFDRKSYERIIRPMSSKEKNEYFARLFPRIDDDENEVTPHFDVPPREVAAPPPPLVKIEQDLAYRLPNSGKPLAHVVVTRAQAAALRDECAGRAFVEGHGVKALDALKVALPQFVAEAFAVFKLEDLHFFAVLVPGLSDDDWETLKRDEDRRRRRAGEADDYPSPNTTQN
jgi:hypothetical protein